MSGRLEPAVPEAVPSALASFFDRHETLRCDYRQTPDGFIRVLLPAEEVEFEELPLGEHSSASDAHVAVVDHLSDQTESARWPRAGFVTVADDDHLTLFAAFDHVSFDLGSMHSAVDELSVLHRNYACGDGPHPSLARPASHVDHAAVESHRLAGITAADPRLEPWRAALRGGALSSLPPASGIARRDRFDHELVSMPLATKGETAELEQVASAWGASLRTVFTALMLRALAGLEGQAPYDLSALLAINGRSVEQVGAIGWFTTMIPLRLEVDPSCALETLVAQIHAERARSRLGALPIPLVSQLLEVPVHPSLVLAFADHRSSPGVAARRINQARGLLGQINAEAQVHAWVTCLPEGAFLEARHPATRECGGWMATLAVSIRRALLAQLAPTPVFTASPVS